MLAGRVNVSLMVDAKLDISVMAQGQSANARTNGAERIGGGGSTTHIQMRRRVKGNERQFDVL